MPWGFHLSLEWGHCRWLAGRSRRVNGQWKWLCRGDTGFFAFPHPLGNSLLSSWWFGQCFLEKERRWRKWCIWSSIFCSPHNSWLHFLIVIITKNQKNLCWKYSCVEIMIQIQTHSSDTSQYQSWGDFYVRNAFQNLALSLELCKTSCMLKIVISTLSWAKLECKCNTEDHWLTILLYGCKICASGPELEDRQIKQLDKVNLQWIWFWKNSFIICLTNESK